MSSFSDGLLLCGRYAVAPNFFGYCGPSKTASLIDHLQEDIADQEMTIILSQFETLYPYLQLISRKNNLPSPFLPEVVEAYWLGNHLLRPLNPLEFHAFAQEKLFLEKKIVKEKFSQLKAKINNFTFLPHHSFHVFNIFKRTGKIAGFQTLSTMDNCRIGWGKIKMIDEKSKIKILLVETKPLLIKDDQLVLGHPLVKEIKTDLQGKSFIKNLTVGDWVSLHWGHLCDKLTKNQVKNLEHYTIKAIEFFNLG